MLNTYKWFLFIPTLFLVACASNPQIEGGGQADFTIDELKQRAEMAGYAGAYKNALLQWQKILEKEPDNVDALIGVGESLLAADQPKRAENYFERALVLDSKNSLAREARAISWLMQGNYTAARSSMLNLVDDGLQHWRVWNGLGIIADIFGEYTQAQEYYQRAIYLEPERAILHNNLGYSQMMAHDYYGGEISLKKALQLAPGNAMVINNLALCTAWLGRYDEAVDMLLAVMDEAAANNNIGYVAYLRNEYALAKELFAKAMRLRSSYYIKAANNLEMVNRKLARE